MPIELDDEGIPRIITRHPDGPTLLEIHQLLKQSPPSGGIELTVTDVIELLLDARDPGRRPSGDFVRDAMRLWAYEQSLRRSVWPRGSSWPNTPGIAFAGWVGESAFRLILTYVPFMLLTCFRCDSIVDHERGGIDATRDEWISGGNLGRAGIRWETRANSERACSWRDEWSQAISDPRDLPPRDELPDWQLVREWRIVESQFNDELRRYRISREASSGSAADESAIQDGGQLAAQARGEKLLSIHETAERLGIDRATLRRHRDAKPPKIPPSIFVTIGSKEKVLESKLDAWISEMSEESQKNLSDA